MKFLIDNYSDSNSTQSLYLNKHLNECGHTSFLRIDPNQSLYDALDIHVPDIYITSAHTFSKDLILYITENQQTNLKLIVCVNGANQNLIEKIEDLIKANNINCLFFFGNKKDVKTKSIKYLLLPEATDINIIVESSELKYNIQKAVIVTDRSKIKRYDGTYHVISLNQNMQKCDFFLPVTMFAHLYFNYQEVIVTDFEDYIPQYVYDALSRNIKLYYDIDDTVLSNKMNETLMKVFKLESDALNYNSSNKLNNFLDISAYVNEKHTSLNRTKTLLSQIPNKILENVNG